MNIFGKSQTFAIAVGVLVMGAAPGFSDTFDPTGYIADSEYRTVPDKAFTIIPSLKGYDSRVDLTGYMTLSHLNSAISHDPTGYIDMVRNRDSFRAGFTAMLGVPEISSYDVKADPTGYLTLASVP